MTTYISFTPDGGRIGRIAWDNRRRHIWWDRWWPAPTPSLSRLAQLAADIQQAFALAAQALAPSVEQATRSILQLGKAFAQIGRSAGGPP